MLIRTQSTGTARKRLVDDVSEYLEAPSRYLGAPSMAYEIGDAKVLRDGSLELPAEDAGLMDMLERRGHEPERESAPEGTGLTIELPAEAVDAANMAALLAAKGTLIEHALGIESLPMVVGEETVAFPWFKSMPGAEDAAAATALIAAMARMSRQQRRVSAKPADAENEKYAFRCFLLRLGFIGDGKKAERKALLRRLSGNAAFKTEKEDRR